MIEKNDFLLFNKALCFLFGVCFNILLYYCLQYQLGIETDTCVVALSN